MKGNLSVECFYALISRRGFHVNRILEYREDYDKLGLNDSAGEKEVKEAYYRLAKQLHPDAKQNKSSSKEFYEVTQAYRRLLKDVQQGRNNFKRSETERNLDHPGWYGFDSRQSYYSKNRVLARKINMIFKVSILSMFGFFIMLNIFMNKYR